MTLTQAGHFRPPVDNCDPDGPILSNDKGAKLARLSKIRRWRQREGLTLAEVSGLTGLSVAMLSLVERGQRRLLPKTKVRVARRLGVPLRELFDVEDLAANG
jgi:DNA-binding XRE family transcriptional regulator